MNSSLPDTGGEPPDVTIRQRAERIKTRLNAHYGRDIPIIADEGMAGKGAKHDLTIRAKILFYEKSQSSDLVRYTMTFALSPKWTFGLTDQFKALVNARWALHDVILKYITLIHAGIIFNSASGHRGNDNVVTFSTLQTTSKPTWRTLEGMGHQKYHEADLEGMIVRNNHKIEELHAAETIWGPGLHKALVEQVAVMSEEVEMGFVLFQTIKFRALVAETESLPSNPTESLESAMEWIIKFNRVIDGAANVFRYLLEFVAGIPGREVTQVIGEDFNACGAFAAMHL